MRLAISASGARKRDKYGENRSCRVLAVSRGATSFHSRARRLPRRHNRHHHDHELIHTVTPSEKKAGPPEETRKTGP